MNIGIFDSGLGGLLVTQSITELLPQYDYIYLGDTKRVPYGNRPQQTIYEFTRQAVDWLCRQDCKLIVLACNTASAEALRRIQQEYLPDHYPDCRVLGVIIPTAEAVQTNNVGVLATRATVASDAYGRELRKLNPKVNLQQVAAPLLVPLIENDGRQFAPPIISHYLEALRGVDSLILGCTHYSAYKDLIRFYLPGAEVICQDEIIPTKLADYLHRHPELEQQLSQTGKRRYCLTDFTAWAAEFLGDGWKFERIDL